MTVQVLIQKTFRYVCNHFLRSDKPMTIVTGANYEYFETLTENLLDTISEYEKNTGVVVWDLGMTASQLAYIKENYPFVTLKNFDFSVYPEHYALSRQSYAWKPACIHETVKECKTDYLFWMDAGCRLKGHLNGVRRIIQLYGFYSPFSRTKIEELTYPSLIKEFALIESSVIGKRMLNAAIIGFDMKSKLAREILWEWYHFSMIPDFIIPFGSNRSNHRQDQSLLSLLYYKHRDSIPLLAQRYYDFLSHQRKDGI